MLKSLLFILALLVAAPLAAQTVSLTRGQVPAATTLQSAVTGNANGTSMVVSGYPVAMLTVTCTTCGGGTTVNFEGSLDGSTFFALYAYAFGTASIAATTTATGNYQVQTGSSLRLVRARVSAYSAGTITVTGYPGVSGGTPLSAGSGFSAIDAAAYTVTSSSFVPVGGVYQSSVGSLSDGAAGAAAMTATRDLHVSLYSNAGNALIGQKTTANSVPVALASDATLAVTGTFWQTTQPVSLATLPALVAGAAVIGHVIADTGSTTAVTGNVATTVADAANVNQGANADAVVAAGAAGTISAKLRAISRDLVANIVLAAGANVIGHVIADTGSTTAVTGNVTVVQPTAANLNAAVVGTGTAGTPAGNLLTVQGVAAMTPLFVGGNVATNVAVSANPVNTGFQAVSSENTAVTTARMVQGVADLVGKQIVLPYANPENFVSGVTAAMTGTTTTSIMAAPAAGLRNYITHMMCTNSHATVGTFVIVQDGSGGTTFYEGYAAAVGGGFSMTLPTPLRQPTTATAVFVADVTTGANVICSASGYKGA